MNAFDQNVTNFVCSFDFLGENTIKRGMRTAMPVTNPVNMIIEPIIMLLESTRYARAADDCASILVTPLPFLCNCLNLLAETHAKIATAIPRGQQQIKLARDIAIIQQGVRFGVLFRFGGFWG